MELVEFFNFLSYVLYLYVAWLGGVLFGYILATRNMGD